MNNDYLLNFIIFDTINIRLKKFFNNQFEKEKTVSTSTKQDEKPWFTIPYIPNVSEKFFSIVMKDSCELGFF